MNVTPGRIQALCSHCRRPVLAGEPRHGGVLPPIHWSCFERLTFVAPESAKDEAIPRADRELTDA